MKYRNLSKYEKLKITGLFIKAVFGTIGASLIIEQNYPYVALTVLALGAGVNEVISFLKDRETQYSNKSNESENFPTN